MIEIKDDYLNNVDIKSIVSRNSDLVQDILPRYLSILSGEPKCGKSMFVLDLAVNITTGNQVLGKNTVSGNVLYLSLEDDSDEIIKRIGNRRGFKHSLDIISEIEPKGLAYLNKLKQINEDKDGGYELIIIDTLPIFMNFPDKVTYADEYACYSKLFRFCLENKLNILAVGHTSKLKTSSASLTRLYGTHGLSASLNGILMLTGNSPKQLSLDVKGKTLKSTSLIIGIDDNRSFHQKENSIEHTINPHISAVLNYVVDKKGYQGTCITLVSTLKLCVDPRYLGRLLKEHEDFFLANSVEYTTARTNNTRSISFKYTGV